MLNNIKELLAISERDSGLCPDTDNDPSDISRHSELFIQAFVNLDHV